MPLRLVKDSEDKSIPVCELRHKQIAEIVIWSAWQGHVGDIVCQDKDHLRNVSRGTAWDEIPEGDGNRVRVIPNGIIQLEVFDND